MIQDYKSYPMTPEEEEAWNEHERWLSMGHDRAAYMEDQERILNLNRAICEAIANQEPWEK